MPQQIKLFNVKVGDTITKKYKVGENIQSIDELIQLSYKRKAVFYTTAGIYIPAARFLKYSRSYHSLYNLVHSKVLHKLELK